SHEVVKIELLSVEEEEIIEPPSAREPSSSSNQDETVSDSSKLPVTETKKGVEATKVEVEKERMPDAIDPDSTDKGGSSEATNGNAEKKERPKIELEITNPEDVDID